MRIPRPPLRRTWRPALVLPLFACLLCLPAPAFAQQTQAQPAQPQVPVLPPSNDTAAGTPVNPATGGPLDRKQPFHRMLISVKNNYYPPGNSMGITSQQLRTFTSRYTVPDCPTAWRVQMNTLQGGKQSGTDVIHVDNGKLAIFIIPTRGMGLLSVVRDNVRVGWDSPVKNIVNPIYMNLNNRGGLGWLDGFTEMMCRCGIEWNGHPGQDRFTDTTGAISTLDLTLHGRIANLPAQEVEFIALREPPYTLTIRGRVDEAMFHGPKLQLYSELSTEPGSNTFRIRDVIVNKAGQPQEFQMLYHSNFGPPILEEGAKFLAPVERITPFNDHAASGLDSYDTFEKPTPGYVEQVYCLKPKADANGRTLAVLRDKAGKRAVSIRYATAELPYLTLWKNTEALDDGYVTGLEPGTNFPNTRRVEREHNRVPILKPGGSYAMALEYGIHFGEAEVQPVVDEVARIQGDARPTIDQHPEKK